MLIKNSNLGNTEKFPSNLMMNIKNKQNSMRNNIVIIKNKIGKNQESNSGGIRENKLEKLEKARGIRSRVPRYLGRSDEGNLHWTEHFYPIQKRE
jgi:hypothetical protein